MNDNLFEKFMDELLRHKWQGQQRNHEHVLGGLKVERTEMLPEKSFG